MEESLGDGKKAGVSPAKMLGYCCDFMGFVEGYCDLTSKNLETSRIHQENVRFMCDSFMVSWVHSLD
jgi:hypothetical protein